MFAWILGVFKAYSGAHLIFSGYLKGFIRDSFDLLRIFEQLILGVYLGAHLVYSEDVSMACCLRFI